MTHRPALPRLVAARCGLRTAWVVLLWLALGSALALATGNEQVGRQVVVELLPGGSIDAVIATYGGTLTEGIPEYRAYLLDYPTPAAAAAAVAQMLAAIPGDPNLESAEPHKLLEDPEGVAKTIPILDRSADSEAFRGQQAATLVRAPLAHTIEQGRGVVVAVVDTGFELDHPEIRAQFMNVAGGNFAPGTHGIFPSPDGIDNDGDGSIDEALHHGTQVAGLISLLAPQARILPIRALDEEGRGSSFAVTRGILFALRQGADVINLSLGTRDSSHLIKKAIDDADARGAAVVAAAGNGGLPSVDFPCNESKVICVAAVDQFKIKPPFSNYEGKVDISAPGVQPLGPWGAGDYARWDGSSFAVPMVSGALALLVGKYPGLSPDELLDRLQSTAQPDANPPSLDGLMGAGVLDAKALIDSISSDRSSLWIESDGSGARLSFSPVTGAGGYDILRGELQQLRRLADRIDLGFTTCLANDTTTREVLDLPMPSSGRAFFYLFRDPAGGYGQGAGWLPRIASGGDCATP